MTRADIENRIDEIDARIEEIGKLRQAAEDEATRSTLMKEEMELMKEANRLLRSIGADEDEMYDL